ncbi:MAG: DMT family transporter [Dethiobacteria bacterium]|jgi:RarD protein
MQAKLKIVLAMLIYGSIGAFVRKINLSPSEIAFLRAVIGTVFLVGISYFFRQKPACKAIKRNIFCLGLSGAALGINWILLFQAYEHTSIANATLSYYFAPIFVILLAPLILKEKLTPARVLCVLAAMAGLFLIVKAGNSNLGFSFNHPLGIFYGLSAAAFYASVILLNKFVKNLSGLETTLVQLICAVLVLFPYVMLKDNLSFADLGINNVILILIVGIVHTGFAYFLFFTAIKELKSQTVAVLSYIDPVAAVIIAALFLGEALNFMQITGGLLILGSTFLSEIVAVKTNT